MSETLTNEDLSGICESTFELAHYAIGLGRYFIKSGRETKLADILKEMKRHPDPDHVEELKQIDEIAHAKDKEKVEYV